jgi:thiopeptide-type bacteriocin biosynthesis protein
LYAIGDVLKVVLRQDKSGASAVIATSAELELVLDAARKGATERELVAALVQHNIDPADARRFVDELIASQVLLSNLLPATTGDDPLSTLERRLATLETPQEHQAIADIRGSLDNLDEHGPGAPLPEYATIESALGSLCAPPQGLKHPLNVQLVKPAPELTVSESLIARIRAATRTLSYFGRRSDGLRTFREQFRERFLSREVRLVEALDEESGIAFGCVQDPSSPLLDGISLPRAHSRTQPSDSTPLDELLGRKLHEALVTGRRVVTLDSASLGTLTPLRLPPSFAVFGYFLAGSDAALDAGDYKIRIQAISGPGPKLLGRFCHSCPELLASVQEFVRTEQQRLPDALLVDIAHLPNPGMANVIVRPHLRECSIRYFDAAATDNTARQFSIDDVLVSVVDGVVVLRSRSTGARLIPRLTHSHNFQEAYNLPIYRFLSLVGEQGSDSIGFDWGRLRDMPFLPRVEVGRLILALARWRLPSSAFGSPTADLHERLELAVQLLEDNALPRFVALPSHDEPGLVIDRRNLLSVRLLLEEAAKGPFVELTEYPQADSQQLCVTDGTALYAHDFAVLMHDDAERHVDTPPPEPLKLPTVVPRTFAPGDSEWSYWKLYAGQVTGDRVLRELSACTLRPLQAAGLTHGHYFVRYADPAWHLRVRIRLSGPDSRVEVMERMHALVSQLLENKLVWRAECATYERDSERYGGPLAMPIAEAIFCADSEAAIAVLTRLAGARLTDVRWKLAFAILGRYVAAAQVPSDSRPALMETLLGEMTGHFVFGLEQRRALGAQFRRRHKLYEQLLSETPWLADNALAEFRDVIERLSTVLTDHIPRIRAVAPAARFSQVLGAFLHMHTNRMVQCAGQEHDVVFYDALRRCYESANSRRAPSSVAR